MIMRLLVSLGTAWVLAVPVQAQGTQPPAPLPSQPGFSSTFRFQPAKQMAESLRLRLGSLSVKALRAPGPRVDTTGVACPMPVMQPRPSVAGSMPVQPADSTVAPALNRALILPTCTNYLFAQ